MVIRTPCIDIRTCYIYIKNEKFRCYKNALYRHTTPFTVLLRINAGGVHLIFDIFWGHLFKGGVYTREAFITKYRESYNSIYQRQ